MNAVRLIPCLLLQGERLVKTIKFKSPTYIGDPRNAVRIFNDKEADELVLLDIDASRHRKQPDPGLISEIISEAFMPVAFGGFITDVATARTYFKVGMEKLVLNSAIADNHELVTELAKEFGSQSIMASIDAKRSLFGSYAVFTRGGTQRTTWTPADLARKYEEAGAGEILINSIDRDGTLSGYDLELVKAVTSSVTIPVISCGGARGVQDFETVIRDAGASAASAGSCFVFQGKHRAVLISFPTVAERKQLASRCHL